MTLTLSADVKYVGALTAIHFPVWNDNKVQSDCVFHNCGKIYQQLGKCPMRAYDHNWYNLRYRGYR